MKRVICLFLCAVMLFSITACEKGKPATTSKKSDEQSRFGYMWELIPELPQNFPKLSDFVTMSSNNMAEKTVHVEWCTVNSVMVEKSVEKIEEWAVSRALKQEYDNEETVVYSFTKQLEDNVANIALYYFPQNSGEYDEATNTWQAQLVLEIIYIDTPTDDDTYQLALTYYDDDFTIVNSYKFNGSLCSGLSASIVFKEEKAFQAKKKEIIDKYLQYYPNSNVEESELSIKITNEADILSEQLTKADIIVELQPYGFKR